MTSVIENMLLGATHDGMKLGMKMAVEMLEAAKPRVDVANQTWDSAIAVLNIQRAELEAKALSAAPGEAGE